MTQDRTATLSAARQGIQRIEIDPSRSESPTFEGRFFGPPGRMVQYEKLRGTAYCELDPTDPRNAVITDIELAPVNERGMVEYSMDIFILKPMDLALGNRRVILDFNNRGGMRVGLLNDARAINNPTAAADAGTGFIFDMGFAVVGNGWDISASGHDSMTINVPVATNPPGADETITGPSYEYIVFDNETTTVSDLAYPAATLDRGQACLTVKERLDDTPVEIPESGWEYTSDDGKAIRLLPEGTPFKQSHIYEFTYTAKNPLVAGIGLAATRDFLSFLRHAPASADNPLAGHVDYTYSYSISQPSRTLNDFQLLGFNEDEYGQRALDGILSHTGGGNGDQINYRFAQTDRTERNRQNHRYPEAVFPFAHQVTTDHLSGRTAGRSEKGAATNTLPKRLEINTASEYWVKGCSQLHTDSQGNDLPDPENVRYYLLSGLSHGVGDITRKGKNQQFTNGVSPYAAHRALLVALDKWVSEGIEPPASRVPRASEDAAFAVTRPGFETGVVPREELGWPDIPGVTYSGVITTHYFLDYGPDFDQGIVTNLPPSLADRAAYPIFVSKVDEDGNEVAGVRLPAVAAPVATTTGWALRRAGFGENDGGEGDGQHIPFAVTKEERLAAGDPRLSLEERYGTHENYVNAVAQAARQLESDGFLLAEDVQAYIDEAEASDVLKG